jgi:hypothetical protein
MKLNLYAFSLTATAIVATCPASMAHGIPSDHTFAMTTHDKDRHRSSGYDFGFPYGAYGVSYYDETYCYTPTPEQIAAARKQVDVYLLSVEKHRKHPATHRYISVETLRPTKKQLEDYTKKRSEGKFASEPEQSGSSSKPTDASKLRCLMVYDTQTKQFVGSGCYLVADEPTIGNVSIYQTVSAEFVGQNAL